MLLRVIWESIRQLCMNCTFYHEIKHKFTTKSITKNPLRKLLDINIKKKHCVVKKVCFLCE